MLECFFLFPILTADVQGGPEGQGGDNEGTGDDSDYEHNTVSKRV